jgi:hypothetical protein
MFLFDTFSKNQNYSNLKGKNYPSISKHTFHMIFFLCNCIYYQTALTLKAGSCMMVHGSERVKIFWNIHSGIHAVLVFSVNLFPILSNGQFKCLKLTAESSPILFPSFPSLAVVLLILGWLWRHFLHSPVHHCWLQSWHSILLRWLCHDPQFSLLTEVF